MRTTPSCAIGFNNKVGGAVGGDMASHAGPPNTRPNRSPTCRPKESAPPRAHAIWMGLAWKTYRAHPPSPIPTPTRLRGWMDAFARPSGGKEHRCVSPRPDRHGEPYGPPGVSTESARPPVSITAVSPWSSSPVGPPTRLSSGATRFAPFPSHHPSSQLFLRLRVQHPCRLRTPQLHRIRT